MADVTINNNLANVMHLNMLHGGPYWVSTTTAYLIYSDNGNDLCWDKTTDGGASWAGQTEFVSGTIIMADTWADWQTPGDSGEHIHIAYADGDTDQVRYCYLDTNDDTIKGDDLIYTCEGTGILYGTTMYSYNAISITKTVGGNIAVAFRVMDDGFTRYRYFYTSPDGDTWTARTTPWESHDSDIILLFPANLADTDDLWAVYFDDSASELSLKTFDDSGDSWSETSISGSIADLDLADHRHDGVIRHSDGHLILAAWNLLDNASADLKTWDITDAGTITAKTDVVTDYAESGLVGLFINQSNNYIYAAYAKGGTYYSETTIYYQYSDDGMATWEGETAMQADAADDERWISAGAVRASTGGKFLPVWFNDDLNDLFCNTDNAVAIAASGGGGWTNIAKINGVTATDLAKVDGISVDDIAKICGVAV